MRNVLLLVVMLYCVKAQAQIVGGVDIAKVADLKYVEVRCVYAGFFTTKMKVLVDYGQEFDVFRTKKKDWPMLQDATGKNLKFNSKMDVVNYFANLGWVLESSYVATSNKEAVYHYLFKRG